MEKVEKVNKVDQMVLILVRVEGKVNHTFGELATVPYLHACIYNLHSAVHKKHMGK